MRKRLVSFIVLLVVAGSAIAGAPLHSNEQSCRMGEMDCCKKVLSRSNTPQVAGARLCCSLNCSQSGTTSSNGLQVQPQTQPSQSAHVTIAHIIPRPAISLRQSSQTHSPPIDSHPAYIRHLALLI